MIIRLAMLSVLSVLSAVTSAATLPAVRPTVVELFTSQGCSSCPPADALLGELKSKPNVLALAFHVTYCWSDRFALPYADQRQSRYARSLKLSSVFTPQVIVDGRQSFVGSDRGGILPEIAGERPGVGISIAASGAELQIGVAAAASAAGGDVLLFALLPEAQTAIGRGENSGRSLREFNIVRASFALGAWDGSARNYVLKRASLPPDATTVAVVLQQSDQRSILGAATYSLR
jgi:hypothetical protein